MFLLLLLLLLQQVKMTHQRVQSSKKMMTNELNRAEVIAVETQSVLWLALASLPHAQCSLEDCLPM
jgi:hypothetical protein